MRNYGIRLLLLLMLVTALQRAEGQPGEVCDFSASNLNALRDKLAARQSEYNIPGLAIVIVKKGKIVFSETFGLADIEKKIAVTANTVFPIGSSSKPLTAVMISLLVSEGKMGWNDPVEDYLPGFTLKLKPEGIESKVTIADLMSHRTGLQTMPLTVQAVNFMQDPEWNPKDNPLKYSREALIGAMCSMEAVDTFRQKFNYSNIGIVAAAEASAKAMNMSWDKMITEMLFRPLEMYSTTTSIEDIEEGDQRATGYLAGENGNIAVPATNMDVISPAGGINSTLNDMAKMLQFLLTGYPDQEPGAGGREMMWSVQAEDATFGGMLPGYSYGMGWFLKEWNSYRVAEHMGNGLGFSANLSVIPELGVGYAVLSNIMPSSLQHEIDVKNLIWEMLIHDARE